MTARVGALALFFLLGGCAVFIDRATDNFAEDLESAIRSYSDPDTVASALPAYLLLLEARLESRPDDAGLRLTTARLTQTHASLFAGDRQSPASRRLTARALEHARIGACRMNSRLCDLEELGFDAFEARVESLERQDLDAVYVLATSWVSWIAAHSDDFHALAELPRAEELLQWVVDREPGHDDGAGWLYLGVLHSQRPPAAGGQPDRALAGFELAREESDGQNGLINVLMADSYARLLFDRDLYVELLEEVLEIETDNPDYRLVNMVARQRAEAMLEQTEEIFD